MMKSPKAPRWEKTNSFSRESPARGLGRAEVDISVPGRRAPAGVLGGHIDRVEILLELGGVEPHGLEQEARDPFFDFEHHQLLAEAALGVAVQDGGYGVERQDLVDEGGVQVLPRFGARQEVG